LREEGFAVVTANGGRDGLKRAKELHPIAITLDVLMPDLDGWTVLAALRGNPALADIPVVMATITDQPNKGMTLGAAGYLTKPIDRERLIALLRPFQAQVRRTLFAHGRRRPCSARISSICAGAAAMARDRSRQRPCGARAVGIGEPGCHPP
jgi:CheY-like chemotaxis protein